MTIKKGDSNIDNVFLGDTQVNRIYKGDEIVWELTVAEEPLLTTINPAETVQNNIPITVTLTANKAGATIHYLIGNSTTTQTYTGPFTVNQNHPNVQGVDIKVTYWSVLNAETEAQKSIIYDTRGAMPSKPVVTATVGENTVTLNWGATSNTTSYNVYRSTTAGQIGTLLNQYGTALTYTDNTAVGGTTYYYTVRSANYWNVMPSDQVTATPTAPPPPTETTPSYRFLKIEGYGATEAGQEVTTRMIEVEAWVGTRNALSGKTPISFQTHNAGTWTDANGKNTITNGVKTSTGYPIWWTSPTPNANVVFDLGVSEPLTKLNYYGYSVSGVQRANRFRILGSNTNNGTDWVELWNMQNNTALQPILPNGYDKTL
jgi:hypothetical protein